jgi:hypothetical protein
LLGSGAGAALSIGGGEIDSVADGVADSVGAGSGAGSGGENGRAGVIGAESR